MWLFRKDGNGGASPANQFCSQHGSPLDLYCLEDEKLLCSSCRLENGHNKHELWPVEQAAKERKRIVGDSLETLMTKLEVHKQAHVTLNEMAQHVKSQTQQTEREIRDEYEKLHQFLREEEKVRIAALKEEKEQKSQMLKQRIQKITEEMSTVLETRSIIEQALEAENLSFLQNYLSTIKRTWHSLQDPQDSSGMVSSIVTQSVHQLKSFFLTPQQMRNATLTRIYSTPLAPKPVTGSLIDVAKHLGNLKYRVWENMLGTVQYTPVTLDPNTAAPCLSLSEELTSIQFCTGNPQLPDNPERFTFGAEMLGSEGFTSGRHCWEVQVGDNTNWAVGVAKKSILRKAQTILGQEVVRRAGLSALRFRNGCYSTEMGPVSMRNKPRWVRVKLDGNSGTLAFSDAARNRPITTFKIRLTEPVYPYFYSSCKDHSLQIAPENISISVGALKKENVSLYRLCFLLILLNIFYWVISLMTNVNESA